MADVETLGTMQNAVVISFALVPFDLDDSESNFQPFTGILPAQFQLDAGRKIDASTLMFWLGQSDAAKLQLLQSLALESDDLPDTLKAMSSWISALMESSIEFQFWGFGDGFDSGIVRHLMTTNGVKWPVPYRAPRDLRTLIEESGLDKTTVPLSGNYMKHDPLSDCHAQIRWYYAARQLLGTNLANR